MKDWYIIDQLDTYCGELVEKVEANIVVTNMEQWLIMKISMGYYSMKKKHE